MAAAVQMLEVGSPAEMETAISSYVVQGFVIANKTATSATMIKRKEFSTMWAVIGFVLCIVPLLIYLIVYATQSDQVVEIRVRAVSSPTDNLAELQELSRLRDQSLITDEEFDAQKRRLLDS